MGCLRRTLRRTALAFLVNLNSINGTDSWLPGRLPNATHTLLPESLDGPHNVNNSLVIELFSAFLPGLRDLRVELVDGDSIVIDEEQRVIIIHAKSSGMTDVGPYKNEYVFKLFATDDGAQVKDSWEFVDSWLLREIMAKYNVTHG